MKLRRLPKLEFRLKKASHGCGNVRVIVVDGYETLVEVTLEAALEWKCAGPLADSVWFSLRLLLSMDERVAEFRSYIVNELWKFMSSPGYKF